MNSTTFNHTKSLIEETVKKLDNWLVENNYEAYDPFDGLLSTLRILTLKKTFPQRILQQSIRRIPINIRPFLGIKPHKSSKGISFIASGYLNMYAATGDLKYKSKASSCYDWLINNYSKGYSGYCWGNSFDYISRAFYLPKNSPTLVWTSLIGHHFYEAYRLLEEPKYLEVVKSIGTFILNDIPAIDTNKGICLSYVTFKKEAIHNANLLGARMLAEVFELTGIEDYKHLSMKALDYSMNCQREDGSWYYGEHTKYHWIDSWHTAYNLDSILETASILEREEHNEKLMLGLTFYLNNFFNDDGSPKYYWNKDYKYDIQSSSQAIDTLVLFGRYYDDHKMIELALRVAGWTINNMQDKSGYFYLWKNKYFTNKTPTLHWGNGTMLRALTNLLNAINIGERKEIMNYEY